MLSLLHIENVAVIESADIYFEKGLSLLTGETGAGKSIVIDALGAVLGSRVSRDLVRAGCTRATVSAVFTGLSDSVKAWLSEKMELDEDEAVLQRDIHADGRSVCRICGKPVSGTMLKELGGQLVQIHGQNESQTLLNRDSHLGYLDRFGEIDAAAYGAAYAAWTALSKEKNALNLDEAERERRLDMLRFQAEDIEKAELQPGEDEELNQRRLFFKNAAKLTEALETAVFMMDGDDEQSGALDQLDMAARALSSISHLGGDIAPLYERLEDLRYTLMDVAEDIRQVWDDMDASEEERDEVEVRLDEIYRLKQKYGKSVAEILAFGQACREELTKMESSAERLAQLETLCTESYEEMARQAEKLTVARKRASKRLEKALSDALTDLDMGKARLSVTVEANGGGETYSATGADAVTFLLSANVGEPPKPLNKIASGGELARVMLALQSVLVDEIGTMVFDEVDTGVSGRAAQKVAEKLLRTSRHKQIICVTHLPQMAAMADTHLHVEKGEADNRTVVSVRTLDGEGRQRELARLTGGASITELTLQNAAELLSAAERYKKESVE